ncbi:MAG: DUF1778 domain-containing protein [Planctomycetaceae bacterium]
MNRSAAEEPPSDDALDDSGDLILATDSPEQPSAVGALLSIQFDPESARLIRRAAANDGVTQVEFVRRAALATARETVTTPR